MRNIKLEIEYDGRRRCGWQVQPRKISKKPSVQESLENTLRKILQEKIRITGAGRTDSGVHALAQIANFKTNSDIPVKKLQLALNGNLPKDISINKVEEVSLSFHSRFKAKSKVYRYTILNRAYPSALLKGRVQHLRYPLDVGLMRREARCLVGRHDFSSFRASGGQSQDSVRRIKSIRIARSKDLIHLEIEADGFLYNMVRNIAGTLIEIGRHKFKKGDTKKILLARNRRLAGPTAPACGLFLVGVRY